MMKYTVKITKKEIPTKDLEYLNLMGYKVHMDLNTLEIFATKEGKGLKVKDIVIETLPVVRRDVVEIVQSSESIFQRYNIRVSKYKNKTWDEFVYKPPLIRRAIIKMYKVFSFLSPKIKIEEVVR